MLGCAEADVANARNELGITPVYGLVDTCAAEFVAQTPYFYSTYGSGDESPPSDRKKIMIIGGGPNRIGQGIEFDYCCVHASFALSDAGFETIMVNSNPETVSTDYDTSDRLYFEPLTLEDVLHIYRREDCHGVIVQFGGQTPLNLARGLADNGVNILGTSPTSIEAAEDRKRFQELASRLNIRQPDGGIAVKIDEAEEIAESVGYPVLLRPSFVLGGRAMVIVYDRETLRRTIGEAIEVSEERSVLIDHYLEDAIEVDVDCIADGETAVIGAIMEHVELAGVHSGDSACIIPAFRLSGKVTETIRNHTMRLARELGVVGLMNIQFAVKDDEVYVLEVNPRASRTVPYVSKSIGVPLAKVAALVMVGCTLKEIGFTEEIIPRHVSVKEAVFPFVRFHGVDVVLSPEMKSTGEVMGIDTSLGMAFLKSQVAAGNPLPLTGNVFLSVRDSDKSAVVPLAKKLAAYGFKIYATRGTSTVLRENQIQCDALFKISEGRPNVLDMVEDKSINWIVNTPSSGASTRIDETKMRASVVTKGIPITTTLAGLRAAITGLEAIKDTGRMEVCSIQEYHRHAPRLKLKGLRTHP